MTTTKLDGQVALVTGASRGIGRAIARHLAQMGATVFVNFLRSAAAADETVRCIREAGGRAELAPFDVADPMAAADGVGAVAKAERRLDILVNNAGLTVDDLVLRLKPEEWDQVMAVNLRGTFNCTRAAAKTMVRARYGRIVNLSSVIGLMGNAGQGAYATAKAGIIGFTKAMARELASRNITVNAVAPGFIGTDMTSALTEAQSQQMLDRIPLGRMGAPEEVAHAVAFLVSEQAGYVTGATLPVNGGLYMG